MELNLTTVVLMGLLAWGGRKEWDTHRAHAAPVVPYADVASSAANEGYSEVSARLSDAMMPRF